MNINSGIHHFANFYIFQLKQKQALIQNLSKSKPA